MFSYTLADLITFPRSEAPRLIVFVDAEEEFRWHTFSPQAISVRNIAAQVRAQDILNKFGVKPTYLVDYAVASQVDGVTPLKRILEAGQCGIGAQLHPWVNPPIDEEITIYNTYPGNLPAALERAKIDRLTQAIVQNFGVRPRVFKAGRYGAGPNTASALIDAGYTVDASVMPLTDFSTKGGPDYTESPAQPYWIDRECRLLEIPNTVGLVGLMDRISRRRMSTLLSTPSIACRIPAVLSRLGLLERIRLTPEGISLDDAKRMTLSLLQRDRRLFVLSYHSSSLLPGGSPYVADEHELKRFLGWLDGYMRFFFGAMGGQATTAEDVLTYAQGCLQRAA
jgi:hypothetical protein